MMPVNIVDVLTAAAPIVATLATVANKKSENNNGKDSPKTNVSVTINNNFYTKSQEEAVAAASTIQKQMVDSFSSSGNRYIL